MRTILISSFCLFFSLNIHAQEIGISLVKIWTYNYEIQNPYGIGFSLSKDIWNVKVKAEYIYAKNDRSYEGYMEYGFLIPPSPYSSEQINSTSSFTAYEFSVNLSQALYADYLWSVGFGITFDKFTATRKGLTSGKTVNYDDKTKSGPFLAVSISRNNIVWQPIRIEILYKIKALSNGYSATDIELPFAGIKTVQELQLSLAYRFH
jgi:hypothetical protein